MANKFTIWINDNVNLSGFGKVTKALGEIKDRAEKMHRSFKDGFEAGKKALDVFFAPLKAVAVPAIGAVTTAFGLAIKAVREFAGQELGEADVTSALKAMGQYTDQYRDRLIALSNTYQTTTGIADDFWLKSLGQLTRFGMNAGNVDKVSEALKNLTGLMDGNIDTATDALAKALQGEFAMFSRFGIVVEKSGDDIKDLDNIINAINTKGAGLLEARANTLSGKWTALKNQANEVFEAVGSKLAGALNVGGAIDDIKAKLATLTSAIQSGGLGDLLEKGGEALRKKIEDAVKWAEKIATAIQESGKPVEQVFSEALHAAAGVFWTALQAGVQASMSIWKAAGIAIFNTIEEQVLASSWMQGTTTRMANKAFDSASPEQKAGWSKWRAENPDATQPQFKAHVASGNSDDEIVNLIKTMSTDLKEIWKNLGVEMKATAEKAFGVSPDGTTASGGGKSTITIQGSDGEEITMALEEYIKQLSAQNDKLAEAAEVGTEAATTGEEKATQLLETTKSTSEAATKSADAAVEANKAATEAHGKVTTALDSSKTASLFAAQAADRNIQITEQALILLNQMASKFARSEARLAQAESNIKSMRA